MQLDVNNKSIIQQMRENSLKWHSADDEERARLEKANQTLGQRVGAVYNTDAGTWGTKTGERLYDVLDKNESDAVYSIEVNPDPVKVNQYGQPKEGERTDTETTEGAGINIDTKIADAIAEANKGLLDKMKDTLDETTGGYQPENETDYTGPIMIIGIGLIVVGIIKTIFGK